MQIGKKVIVSTNSYLWRGQRVGTGKGQRGGFGGAANVLFLDLLVFTRCIYCLLLHNKLFQNLVT